MPAGPAAPNRRIPRGFARLGRLPQRKIARRVLLVLVQVHAGAVLHPAQILLAQLAVIGEGREAKVPAPVLGLVSRPGRRQPLNQFHHARNVLGGPRDDLRPLNPQGIQILKKSLLETLRVLADGNPCRRRVANNLVVHVGDVHHVADADSGQLQEAPQHVHLQERAEVADVAVVVDRGPAGVHAEGCAVGGRERVHLSREGIKEAQGHRLELLFLLG